MYLVSNVGGATRQRVSSARRLDPIDLKILAKLQREGRITTVRLAEHVNLSTSACHDRVACLTSDGLIKSFHADVDLQRIMRYELVVVEITLGNHSHASFERFERRITAVPEVVECIAVGGGIDYIVKFAVTGIGAYQELFEQLLQDNIGIKKYVTYIATKVIKPTAVLPIEYLYSKSRREAQRS